MKLTLSKLFIIIVFLLGITVAVLYVGGFLPTWTAFPNMYEGEVTFYEFCPNYPKYCYPMKVVSDRDTGKARVISEGYVEADREISSAFVKIYYEASTRRGKGMGVLQVYIYNYKTGKWKMIVNKGFDHVQYYAHYDIGDRIRAGDCDEIVTDYGQCCSYQRDYKKTHCSVDAFNASEDYIDETGKRLKFKLDMFVEGREDNSVNVVEVNSIWADFTYLEPETPEEPEEEEAEEEQEEEQTEEQETEPKEEDYEPEEYEPRPSFWQRIWLSIINFFRIFKWW